MPYPYKSPFLDDEAEILGIEDSKNDLQETTQALNTAVPPNLSDKFIAPKLGELPGFVGDDIRIPIMKPPIPETEMTKQAMAAGTQQLRPPTIDQSNLQAYTQHLGTSPFGKKPGFWNKLAAGLYGGASVLAATQAQPHVTRVNPGQIAAGVQGLLKPGQARAMQEWDFKRRGLEDAARLEAANNATRMRQYGIEAQEPLNQSRIEMNRKHGDLYDAIGYSRLFNTMNPRQTALRMATNREALVTEDLQKRLNSSDPAIQAAARQELEGFKKQQQLRVIPAAQRTAIQALKQQYIDQGIDDETATIYATQDWAVEQGNQQELKNTESTSRVKSNEARAKRDEAQANRTNRTSIGGVARPSEARAATAEQIRNLVSEARAKTDNDPAKAIDYINGLDGVDSVIKNRAIAELSKQRDRRTNNKDNMAIIGMFDNMVKPNSSGTPTGNNARNATSGTAGVQQSTTNKPPVSNNRTRLVWDPKTGTTRPK